MRSLRFILIAALVILITASYETALAPVGDPDVWVPRLRIPVNIDGAIIGGEWSDAVTIPTTFVFSDLSQTTRTATIYLKNDCENLWICIQIEDPTENPDSWMASMYDVSGDSSLGPGDDEKAIRHPDLALDVAIIPTPPDFWDNDTDLGGYLDIQGASGWSVGTLTYEFVHPLDSGDAAGNDPALEPGDSILAMYYAGDPEIGIEYMGSGGRYDLITTPCAVGGTLIQTDKTVLLAPVLATLTLTFAVAFTALITSRRRRTQTM